MATTRKSALAIAGAVAGTIAAASVAGAALGFNAGGSSNAGPQPEVVDTFDATTTSLTSTTVVDDAGQEVQVVYEDVYDLPPAPSSAGTSADPTTTAPAPAPATLASDTSAQSSPQYAGDDDAYESEHDDDAYEREHDDGHEYEHEGEFEGHDD